MFIRTAGHPLKVNWCSVNIILNEKVPLQNKFQTSAIVSKTFNTTVFYILHKQSKRICMSKLGKVDR